MKEPTYFYMQESLLKTLVQTYYKRTTEQEQKGSGI